MRRDRYQRVLCRKCGEPFFILPLDPYPKRKVAQNKATQPAGSSPEPSASTPAVAEPVEAASEETTNAAEPQQALDAPVTRKPKRRRSKRAKRRVRRKRFRHALQKLRPHHDPDKPVITRFRVVMAIAAIVIAATVGGILRKNRIERAEQTFQVAADRGFSALDEQNYEAASREFEQALTAAAILDREDQYTRDVRQMYRESTAVSQLAQSSLYEIVGDALQRASRDDRIDLPANEWFVIQANCRSHKKDSTAFIVEYPMKFGEVLVELVIHADALRPLSLGTEPQEIIFGAQLEHLEFDNPKGPLWRLKLNAATAFLWTNYETYRAVGFEVDEYNPEDRLREILAEQSQLVGVINE